MKNTLESHKLFPFFAWTVVIIGAVSVYYITLNVQAELSTIDDRVMSLEEQLNQLEARLPK